MSIHTQDTNIAGRGGQVAPAPSWQSSGGGITQSSDIPVVNVNQVTPTSQDLGWQQAYSEGMPAWAQSDALQQAEQARREAENVNKRKQADATRREDFQVRSKEQNKKANIPASNLKVSSSESFSQNKRQSIPQWKINASVNILDSENDQNLYTLLESLKDEKKSSNELNNQVIPTPSQNNVAKNFQQKIENATPAWARAISQKQVKEEERKKRNEEYKRKRDESRKRQQKYFNQQTLPSQARRARQEADEAERHANEWLASLSAPAVTVPDGSGRQIDPETGEDVTHATQTGRSGGRILSGSGRVTADDLESASESIPEIPAQDVTPTNTANALEIHDMLDDDRDFWAFEQGFNLSKADTKGKKRSQINRMLDRLAEQSAEEQNIRENPDRANPFSDFVSLADQNANPDIEVRQLTEADEYKNNLQQRQQEMIDYMLNAFVKLDVQGIKWTKDPKTNTWVKEIPKDIQHHIAMVRGMYRCSISDVFSLVVARTGLGIDSNGHLPGHTKDYEMSAKAFNEACLQIVRSQQEFGNPMHIVGGKPIIIGGTRCYPMGYIPRSLAISLTQDENSVLNQQGITARQLISDIQNTWMVNTLPNVKFNTQGDGKPRAQRLALYNMMRAMMSADGIDENDMSSQWGIPDAAYITFDSIMQDKLDAQQSGDETRISVASQREEEFNRRIQRLWKNNKGRRSKFDSNGNSIEKNRSQINDACNAIASWERFAGVVLNPPLMVSGFMEKAQGNLDVKLANFLMGRHVVGEYKAIGKAHQMTPILKQMATSREAIEAAGVMQRLYTLAGADAVKAFGLGLTSNHYEVTPEGVAKFIDEYIEPQRAKNPGRFATVAHKIDNWYRDLMEGRTLGFMAGADCKRMLEMALVNNAIRNNYGDKGALNAADIESLAAQQGIGRTMFQLASTDEGFDAFISASNMNLGRKSPISFAIERALTRIGPVNVAITTFFETYLTYGVNLMQLYMPLSNTISYLTVTGFTKIGKGPLGDIYQYQLGGYHAQKGRGGREWLRGLKENLIYDAVKIGNALGYTALAACFIAAMGGLEDPPEDGDWYNWLEWRIKLSDGVEEMFNMDDVESYTDEEGHIFIPAWWLNDLTTYGFPLAIAAHVWLKHRDPGLAWNVLMSGSGSMLEGSSVLDLITLLTHPEDQVEFLDKTFAGDGEYMKPTSATDFQTLLVAGAVDDLTRKMTPAVIRDYFFPRNVKDTFITGQESYNHTASYVYDTVNYTPEEARALNKKVQVDDFEEQYLRAKAKYNPVMAILLNKFRNGYWFDSGHTDKTGYLFKEMPISTMKDQKRAAWGDYFNSPLGSAVFDLPENAEYLQQARMESFNQILDSINEFGGYDADPSYALAQGFWIPPEERISAIAMCYDSILYLEEDFTIRVEAGMSPAEYREAKLYKDLYQNAYYSLLNNWLNNDDMPWSDEGYALLMSDWKVNYYWKGTNDPATVVNYFTNPAEVEKRYVPMGNSKTSFYPFTQVHEKNRGYNFETVPNWYVENLTNPQEVYESGVGQVIPYGQESGRLVNNAIFAGRDDFTYSDEETPFNISTENGTSTIDRRAYVPFNADVGMYLTDNQLRRYGLDGLIGTREDNTYNMDLYTSYIQQLTSEDVGNTVPNNNNNSHSVNGNEENGGTDNNNNDNGTGWVPPTNTDLINQAVEDGVITEAEAAEMRLPGTSGEGTGIKIGDITIDLYANAHNKPTIDDLKERQQAVFNGEGKTPTQTPSWGGGYGARYSSYSRRGSGGGYRTGSGSGYNPKIYSNPRNVNNDRAQGMAVRQPYKATTTYLRPDFVTKGSREAYRRSDI